MTGIRNTIIPVVDKNHAGFKLFKNEMPFFSERHLKIIVLFNYNFTPTLKKKLLPSAGSAPGPG